MTHQLSLRSMFDPGLLLCLLLTLFLVLPMAHNPGLAQSASSKPLGADGGLTSLLNTSLQGLFGLGALGAWRGVLLLCFALCSGGMYAFCKRRSGRLGALIAGLVYVYSPALMHREAYVHGAYPELLAMALFPLLLWRVDALRDKPVPSNFLLACLLQAALLHTRLAPALILTGITLAWLLGETLVQLVNIEASQIRARSGVLAALALLLGVCASARVWLPDSQALLPEFSGSYLTLEDMLSPPPIYDAGALNGLRELPTLGLAQWALAGLGALAALMLYIGGYRTRHPQTFLGAALFATLALLLMALMLPSAEGLWSGSPLLQQLSEPSSLLGPAAACLAIVAGMNGLWLSGMHSRFRSSTIALLVAAPIVSVIPLLYVPVPQSSPEAVAAESGASIAHAPWEGAAQISAVSLLLAAATAWRLRNWQLTPRPYWTTAAMSRSSFAGILLGGAIALLSLVITFREGVAWYYSPPGQALPAQVKHKVSLDGSVQLLGYDLNSDTFRPGGRLVFNAYWYALERPAVDYSSFLYLSAGGPPQLLARKLHPADRPTSRTWSPAGYSVDPYDVNLPADMAAGEYELIIGLYVCEGLSLDKCAANGKPASVGDRGAALGGSLVISKIWVEAP